MSGLTVLGTPAGSSGVTLPWTAATAYKQGQPVTYAGQTYLAKADFTSGASFNAANWTATNAPYGVSIGRDLYVVPIGANAHAIGNGQSTGTETSATYRTFITLTDAAAVSILPGFSNWVNFLQTGDYRAPNPITIAAAVELSDGTVVPFSFGGQHTVTINPGAGIVYPDNPINFGAQTVDATLGSGVIVRTYVTVAAARSAETATVTSGSPTVADASIQASDQGRRVTGAGIPNATYVGTVTPGVSFLLSSKPDSQVNVNATANGTSVNILSYWPLNYGSATTANSLSRSNGTNGGDLTIEGSAGGTSGFTTNANQYGPAVVLGTAPTVRKPIVASLSDSIFLGTTDFNLGPVARACAALGVPHVKLGKFSETAQAVSTVAGRKYKGIYLDGCTHCILELGTNDGADSLAKATALQGYLTTLLAYLAGRGIKVYVCTIPPKSSASTDGYATAARQTPYNTAAALAQINAWIRSVPTNAAGVLEFGDLLSTARDSGLWAAVARGRSVTDAATTNGSNVVTSATANFASGDVGLGLYITGAITSNVVTISSVTDAQTVVASANASASVSGAIAGIGAWYATAEGVHPSTSMMVGAIKTAVQDLISTFAL